MNMRWLRFISTCVMLIFPWIARADETSTMSFAPPTTDISVTFLGNIFGVVDGVLHGTGSQIMGTMLGIFNAAVLALGGIVIMYIILVSTMNTAHEGQMLGQKWSSIWVPVRATMGLALLIPKASGYCLMQIFVMWVVLQGVGVADKIWGAALDYLNRGGVIIQADMAPDISLYAGGGSVAKGGATILYGQVCMAGLQAQIELQRDTFLDAKDRKSGPCYQPQGDMEKFCNDSVPDFINSVNPIAAYNEQYTDNHTDPYYVKMPNFSDSSIYQSLNGICGEIQWNPMNSDGSMDTVEENINTLSLSDMDTIEKSRAAAVEQMYLTLSTTARQMVDNDPQLNGNGASDDDASAIADDQFGIAFTSSQSECKSSKDDCTSWGGDSDFSTASVLLDGSELQDAIADYNAVMNPALKLIDDANNSSDANKERQFISEAKERGWIMAGSYFYDLANINGSAKASTSTDSESGLGASTFSTDTMVEAFNSRGDCNTSSKYVSLCYIFNKDSSKVEQVVDLITGASVVSGGVSEVTVFDESEISPVTGAGSSTVYGYVHNAMLFDLPDQEGTKPPSINAEIPGPDFSAVKWDTPKLKFSCGKSSSWMGLGCYAEMIGKLLYEQLLKPLLKSIVDILKNLGAALYKGLIVYPMVGVTYIFLEGVKIIGEEGVNPIVGIAKMGATFINFSMDTWILALGTAVLGMLPYIGAAIAGFIALCMPFFLMWISVMLGMGFVMTYFVPFYPYIIFTLGTIAWLIAVIESMVAAPIVALGIAHPEGHDALGKSEQGLMILLNVFLRPGMMIIGYIGGIALSFVGVWIMNAGIGHIIDYLQGRDMWAAKSTSLITSFPWTAFFGVFFSALVYTSLYMLIAMKSFTLIAVLPDKVLRWIGGAPEGTAQETMQWAEDAKGKVDEGGKKTSQAETQFGKQAGALGGKGIEKITGKKPGQGPGVEAEEKDDDSGG